jgi:hypothetical protein
MQRYPKHLALLNFTFIVSGCISSAPLPGNPSGAGSSSTASDGGSAGTANGSTGGSNTSSGGSSARVVSTAGGSLATGGARSANTGGVPVATGGLLATGGNVPVCASGSCDIGQPCTTGPDCLTPYTCVSGKCSTCGDGVMDGSEPATDCGGGCATLCPEGSACKVSADCITYNCDTATSTCGVATNPLANIPASCKPCDDNNSGVKDKCMNIVIPCLVTNNCKPTDSCATNNDGVCGLNTLKIDAAPMADAIATYNRVLAGC